MRRWLEASPDFCACVEIRPGDSLVDTFGLLIVAFDGRPGEHGSVEAYLAAVIERAEALEAVCVIEDLHHLSDDRARRLLRLLGSQTERSRWILTGRAVLEATPGVGVVELGTLNEADTHQLAELVGSTLADGATELTPMAVLRAAREQGPPETSSLLEHLSLVDLALSLDDIATLGPLPSDELFAQLVTKGLLVRASGGFRLHDLVRKTIAGSMGADQRLKLATTQADRLGDSERPQTTLEALRAMVSTGRVDAAESLAAQRRAPLLRAGQGLRLWRLLSQADSQGLRRQAFEVAVAIATAESLTWLQAQAAPEDPQTRLRWLKGLLIAGRRGEADRGTRELLAAELAPEIRADATLLLARILLKAGLVDQANRLLDELAPEHEHQRWRAAALQAVACMMAGNLKDAVAGARVVRDACNGLPPEEALAIRADIEPIWLELGSVGDTREPVDESATASNRQMQVLRAMSMTARANPAAAQTLIGALTQDSSASPEERAKFHLAAAGIGIATGNMTSMAQHLEVAIASARESQDWHTYQWVLAARASFAVLAGWPEPVVPWDDAFQPPTGLHALNLIAATHLAALDAGVPSPHDTKDLSSEQHLRGQFSAMLDFCQALSQAMEGDLDDAAVTAERTVARARAGGWTAYVLLALTGSCVVHLMRRDRTALAAASAQFHEEAVGSGIQLARFAAEFFVEAAQVKPQLQVLERIAAASSMVQRPANWAQSLLGSAEPTGNLARLLCEATRDMWDGLRIVHIPGPATATEGWGVDVSSDVLWLAESTELIGIRRFRQFKRFIQYLAANGGSATLEQLAIDVWDVSEYHAMRDENRMRVAVFRYRDLVGDDRDAPRRIITVDGGYALGSDEPVTVAWRPS